MTGVKNNSKEQPKYEKGQRNIKTIPEDQEVAQQSRMKIYRVLLVNDHCSLWVDKTYEKNILERTKAISMRLC